MPEQLRAGEDADHETMLDANPVTD